MLTRFFAYYLKIPHILTTVYGRYIFLHTNRIMEKKQEKPLDNRCANMIKYDKLWQTMAAKDISEYCLYTRYNMSRGQIYRLRHNMNVEVNTIDKLCNILECSVSEIMEHFPDDNVF